MSSPRCRFCDHHNPDSARFCNACGSPLHLKPCPQCEAVNDTAAEQCYECGAALESDASSPALAAGQITMPETPEKIAEARHIPESVGARLDNLTLIQGHPTYTEAERRDAFVRSGRTSGAMFFAVILLILGALGYYGYEYRSGQDANVGPVAASGHEENQPATPERPETVTPPANETSSANPPTISPPSAPAAAPEKPAESTRSVAAAKHAETTEPVAAQTTTPASAEAAPPNVRQPTNVNTVAKQRPSVAPSASRIDPEQYSRPAAASDASAQATQRMIERYLGTRAGASSQRSVQ